MAAGMLSGFYLREDGATEEWDSDVTPTPAPAMFGRINWLQKKNRGVKPRLDGAVIVLSD